jgi:hypothetical protein
MEKILHIDLENRTKHKLNVLDNQRLRPPLRRTKLSNNPSIEK